MDFRNCTAVYLEQFDLITLIYCDYATLPKKSRQVLLSLVHRALKQNGKFIFDVFTPKMRKPENRSWHHLINGGFWSEKPHLWDHFFTKESLLAETQAIGFSGFEFFGDVAGNDYFAESETICCVLTK